jgi:hypothetical protein
MCWKVGREKGATPSQIALAWFPELQSHNNLKVFAKPRLSDVIQKREAPFSRSTSLIVLLLSFIIKYPSKLWDHRQSCEEALRRSTQTQRPPDARGDRASGRRTPSSRARDTRHDREAAWDGSK